MKNLNHKLTFVFAFDCFVQIIGNSTKSNLRVGSKEVAEQLNIKLRTAQRYLSQLEQIGYLVGDDAIPRGYRPTEKAKKLFGGEA